MTIGFRDGGKNGPDYGYLFKSATHWHRRAEEMRALAEDADDATVRAMMLRIAADYEHRSLNEPWQGW